MDGWWVNIHPSIDFSVCFVDSFHNWTWGKKNHSGFITIFGFVMFIEVTQFDLPSFSQCHVHCATI
jgi:hypothetical protein